MKSELKSVKKASFFKRILADIMDGAVSLFVFFALYLFVFTPIANVAFKYNLMKNDFATLKVESHLFVTENENDDKYTLITNVSNDDVSFYKENLKYYFVTFKTTKAPDCNKKHVYTDSGQEMLPSEYYTEAWFDEKYGHISTIEDIKKACTDGIYDLGNYLDPYYSKIKTIDYFIFLSSYLLSFGGFFILVPLLYKNGETFGKKVMSLGLISNDGYSVKKRHVILRQIFLFFYVGLFSFYFTISLASFAMLGIGGFVYYLVAFIVKNNRSFADLLAYTQVIDTKNSVWFKDFEEEKNKEKIVEENLAKYNKTEELDKHVIQIGSTIVNEDAKKEFLESQNEKTK